MSNTDNTANLQPQLPEVREIPTWKSSDTIEMKGAEFESLYNFINELNYIMQGAFGAAQAIMQRNIVNGVIDVNFEKLVTEDGVPSYQPMSEDEAAPHKAKFKESIAEIKAKVAEAVEKMKIGTQDGEYQPGPLLDAIVDQNGNVAGEVPQIVDAIGNPIASESVSVNTTPISDN